MNELEIGNQIGGGGYAIVHEGYYHKKPVAIKIIFDPQVTDEAKKEFMDELNVMKRLHHPNCVSILGAHIKPPKLCYIMELLTCSLYIL